VSLLLVVGGLSGASPKDPGSATVNALRERLEALETADRSGLARAQIAARSALPDLYEEAGYRCFWTPETLATLVALVRGSAEDGLRPEDYHSAELEKLAPALSPENKDPVSRARAEILATDAFYLLLYHSYLGKVDPASLEAAWNFQPRPIADKSGVAFVLDALTTGKLREAVEKVRPTHWWYGKARAALAEYRALAAKGGWKAIPAGPAMKPKTSGPRIVALRQRLAATGDLSGQPLDSPTYDAPLAEAVKKFQARHRIFPDGAVGAGTLAELNVPVEARILQIRVNLERGRWVLQEITPDDLVVVDVAGFEVAYMHDRAPVWRAKIQVGKPYRQTPIFKSKIDTVVFNPTWTVPPGILEKDVLPAARKDPGYFARKGFDVLDASGQKVDPARINLKASNFPYTVRQGPGPDNALGQVKILFPNPYFVYLHDTNHRELFAKDERAFSSGCMRVERPLELAEKVLNDPAKWNAKSMQEAIATGETQTVRLGRPIPVLVMYWTIDPLGEGRTVFKRDPYGRDAPLARALDATYGSANRPPAVASAR
jgi:murein L,D-transpeptidase YcbB/YkuD